jgi:hypothetical protein
LNFDDSNGAGGLVSALDNHRDEFLAHGDAHVFHQPFDHPRFVSTAFSAAFPRSSATLS